MTLLHCHIGVGPKVEGTALVARDNFSARYDLDRIHGLFSRPEHALFGQSYVDKILVLHTAKGGVASAWMLYEMQSRSMAPKAILFNRTNTILTQGAEFANIALCDSCAEGDITKLIMTGDHLVVDPAAGLITVRRP